MRTIWILDNTKYKYYQGLLNNTGVIPTKTLNEISEMVSWVRCVNAEWHADIIKEDVEFINY